MFKPVILFVAVAFGTTEYIFAQPLPTPPKQIITQPGASDKTDSPVVVEDEGTQAARHIRAEAAALLSRRDYAGLDRLAQQLRSDQISYSNGDWNIAFFYLGVTEGPLDAPRQAREQRLQSLREWFERDTDSITARVAYARELHDYAYDARGSGWASTVTDEGWRLFAERLTEARRILDAAEGMADKCPVYYSTRLKIAFLDRSSRERCEELFAQAIEAFPTYPTYYFVKAKFLLPRWHGEPGEWERFAAESADRIGGQAGDMLYAQIIWHMHDMRIFGNIFKETIVEWPRVQRGFDALCLHYPGSTSALSEYCYLAGFAPEAGRPVTRMLLARLGNRVDLSVWKTMDRYLSDRAWTLADR